MRCAGLYFIGAGLERDVAQNQRRLVLAVLTFDELPGLSKNLGIELAVDGDGRCVRLLQAGKLDFEIEARRGQNIGAVVGVNGLRRRWRKQEQSGKRQDDDGAHGSSSEQERH